MLKNVPSPERLILSVFEKESPRMMLVPHACVNAAVGSLIQEACDRFCGGRGLACGCWI